jgi:hypothetical protein
VGDCGVDSAGSGQRPVEGCCEYGDEPSGFSATVLVSQKLADVSDVLIASIMRYSSP